ncbi:geranylgeranylglycerol-phosphate geranylgeranyltransferase [Aquimarina sp. MMG015]|uniref:geranylgeranylglycerol-phosphate geranylgeranyltransferase n=1 Tax=Aquimarina TaxID=290174 RepID=UPI00040DEAA9|nr:MULTISPECIES: geranylgeranylglycerol-phosphate geranylgeranyltransferase [Aquimarina]AXT56892.1 ubiquinone biosynthesis protein UbiA [Aquimarina sp. AD1]MBQ4802901.1 geranylgeranylglycerol-phosphate geranylgeranyltransferase [Aquimarina sp. MMG015]RKN18411.1 ubiquinone biosynthesis protein UbiA [Aquimarina sp. AD1]
MFSRKNKLILLKLLSLFSIVRGYNVLIIVLAQYLTSIFILAPHIPLREVLFDANLFVIVLASASVIAAGYIINNFYDREKDLINRPQKTMLDRLVSQRTKLTGYFVLNFLSVILASYVSFKAVLFFSLYVFGIWLYSHKLKRMPFLGNFVASTLSITPFFAVFIYYKNFDEVVFVHATFLFLMLVMREMVKDLGNLRGDVAQNYKTIPIIYGESASKKMISLLVLASCLPIYLLLTKYEVGYMYLYFYVCLTLLLLFLIALWKSDGRIHYVWLHNILKLIIVSGVFSIILIDVNMILDRLLW